MGQERESEDNTNQFPENMQFTERPSKTQQWSNNWYFGLIFTGSTFEVDFWVS